MKSKKKCTLDPKIRKEFGGCCCECKHQVIIRYHPEFDSEKSMGEIYAYGCNVLGKMEDSPQNVYIFSTKPFHSTCEMFSRKPIKEEL
jgi:hypothetical protein